MLQLVQPTKVIDICGPGIGPVQVQADLENMVAALARHQGLFVAQDTLAEAFAAAFARWSLDSGRAIPARFALEVELDNAFQREEARRTPVFGGAA